MQSGGWIGEFILRGDQRGKKVWEWKEQANVLNAKSNKLMNGKVSTAFSIMEVSGDLNKSCFIGDVRTEPTGVDWGDKG